ncbi:putative Redox-sensitive transcriptional activator [Desulfamplus magnetovallimortis]|uniref:Putative Redox-sensitive transcriptional activator n=1 Tax=Desulfamplus magnetovallimortis TaxID=1246637 RepID=A0A1W1H6V3_9BACT|nr:LysR family transcriptional regulator [Desulfamplus magnetovallimortis]SLM28211.1 putative Redox-sensitive transcriptional activator [Desulfamplus magnetovallimortis]
MDLNKLKTFYFLAQTKNYSRCAEKLFVTQSAVSHAIRTLEESLDLVLIEKKKSGFALTHEGEILFKSCRNIFFEIDKTRRLLLESRDFPEIIRLGSTVEFGMSIVLKGIKDFFDKYPGIHIDFRLTHNLFKPLLDDELDLVIDCKPNAHPDVKSIHLFQEEYAVIASPEYIEKHNIKTTRDLEKCNILSLDRELVWWSNFINALSTDEQVVFNRITEINHVRGIIIAAICSIGVGFVPKYTMVKELEQGELVALFPDMALLNDHINIHIKHRNASLDKFCLLIDYIKGFKLQ